MKKIFTLAAAVLVALTMNAQTTEFLWQYDGSSVYGDKSNNGVFDVTPAASTGSIAFVTYEKKQTSADGTSAYAESVTDADLKPAITKVCKLGNNGAHLRISPASGNFQAGDTLFICGYKEYIVSTSEDPTSTAKITTAEGGAVIIAEALATGDAKGSCAVGYVVLPEGFAETNEIYISRANGNSAGVAAIKVVRPEQKTIVSTEESLTAVTINDVAISATDLASLVSNKYLFLADAYVTAPVVKFTKHTVITYDDESTKEKDEVIEVTSQPATTTWGASATINGNSYYVYTSKAASRTVTYMYGEQVLGTEIVAANGNPAEYAQYETMPLATFGGWYKDADLTQAVANIAAEVISVDATYYAKFTKAFLSESLNIEQLVLDYGTSYDIRSALTAAGWAYQDLNDLDTLNDIENKTARNEPFLGLKLKTTGAYVQGWLPSDGLLIVKFGNVGCDIKVTVKGANTDLEATYTKDQLAEQNYEFPVYGFTEEVLVTFTTTGSSTVVLKQLMMDEIAEVTLPAPGAYLVSCEEAEHGEIKASWPNKKYRTPIGETVTLTVTPNSGYKVVDVQVDGVSLNAVEGVYSFVMPAKDVTVTASFEQDEASAISNTNANVKAVKVVRNGQLFIEKNGVVYNAQGAIVK